MNEWEMISNRHEMSLKSWISKKEKEKRKLTVDNSLFIVYNL